MKLIVYSWGSNPEEILIKNLRELGHVVAVFDCKCEHYTKDLKFAQELINLVYECEAESIISYDYFPIISMVCNTVGIIYYSWVYDSPHYTLFASTSKYPRNRIGCFDRALTKRLNDLGIDTVKHLPLGVDWAAKKFMMGDEGYYDRKYGCDISFVGSLYTGEYNYYDRLCDDQLLRRKADRVIEDQCFEYKKDYIGGFFGDKADEGMDPEIQNKVRTIIERENLFPGEEYIEDIEYIFDSHFLEKKVTVEERKRLLDKVAGIDCDFRLYTGSNLDDMPKLKKANRGYVDYHNEMPKVFASSKINLNITLRSIKTGIPLRALDIMGCGGFLLSNYQEELAENFIEGEELVLYYGLDDCKEKIKYYLTHEDERASIAKAGEKAVTEKFNMKDKLCELIS